MAFLRASKNYVWYTTSVLGKGATGAVYQGVNKTNGEPVAVKTFNQLSHMRPPNVQMREFEVLKKVKHENIVKLLAIEEEQDQRGNVIVMELCTGGSLFNILDDPENTYGLREEEFLLVLEHLTAGMKHLRDNNLVHRDLKPGNIMKFIADDGTTIYKLTDFGAARELQEGQQFVSLYGTEEYLHPDMYARAVLRKPESKTFGATVDLWSIGVTLYHVATGNLPFRPYGGRRNKETMFLITTKKASGVISGIQTKENGPIEWGRELPKSCQLSDGLRKFVTPLLAGLLEVDPKKIWSFDIFFNEVTKTLSRIPLSIFHTNRAELIKVYIHPDETLEHLRNYLTEQTQISSENQIVLLKQTLFFDVVNENSRGSGYPKTTENEPLVLFSKENNNVEVEPESDLPKTPEFQNIVSVENDASQAKAAASLGHVCKRKIEKASLACTLVHNSVEYFTCYITALLNKLHETCQHLSEVHECRQETAQIMHVAQKATNTLLNMTPPSNQKSTRDINYSEELNSISGEFIKEIKPRVQQLHEHNVTENKLKLEWEHSSRPLKCPARSRAPAKARTEVERLRDSWQHLVRDRATRSLSFNDEQFHNLERIKITETVRRLKALLEQEVRPAFSQLADALSDWYKVAQTVYLQTMILNKDVLGYEQHLDKFHENFLAESIQFKEDMRGIIEQRAKNVHTIQYPKNNLKNRQLRLSLHKLEKMKNEVHILLAENDRCVNEVNMISEQLAQDLFDGGDT